MPQRILLCGRRFQIRLVRKEHVAGERIEEKLTQTEAEMESGLMHASQLITPLAEGPSIIVDIEDFEYTYVYSLPTPVVRGARGRARCKTLKFPTCSTVRATWTIS